MLHTPFTPAAFSSPKVIILRMRIPDFSAANCDVADRGLWLCMRNKQLEQMNAYKTRVILAWKGITFFFSICFFKEKQRGGGGGEEMLKGENMRLLSERGWDRRSKGLTGFDTEDVGVLVPMVNHRRGTEHVQPLRDTSAWLSTPASTTI